MLEICIYLSLCLRELKLDVFVHNPGMSSKIGEHEMCMSEEQEVGLFIIPFMFVDLRLCVVLGQI